MSIKVGDKFIIEVGTIAELSDGKKKYFIKPFESLVFDRKGLEQLERLDKATGNIYQAGYEDGKADATDTDMIDELKQVEYIRGIEDVDHAIDVLKSMTVEKCEEWFGGCVGIDDVVCTFTMQEIIRIIKAYEEKKKAEEEIKVGDEVKYISSERTIIVTKIYDKGRFDGINSDGAVYCNRDSKLWNKTGRHTDEVEQLFGKLKGVKSEE